jgi:hypothetical protein
VTTPPRQVPVEAAGNNRLQRTALCAAAEPERTR